MTGRAFVRNNTNISELLTNISDKAVVYLAVQIHIGLDSAVPVLDHSAAVASSQLGVCTEER